MHKDKIVRALDLHNQGGDNQLVTTIGNLGPLTSFVMIHGENIPDNIFERIGQAGAPDGKATISDEALARAIIGLIPDQE